MLRTRKYCSLFERTQYLSMASVLVVRSAGSGEVLAELDGNDFQRMVEAHGNTAKALKLELKDQGFGCRFLQRLLNDSGEIPDDEILVPPLDLKLVRLNLCPFDKADTEALVEASKEGRLEEVETRLKKPQDPNAVNKEGRTALHFAAENNYLECARLLLEAGASCDLATNSGRTALHCAVANGHVEVVCLLLEAGANCNLAGGQEGVTPLHSAAVHGHTEVVRMLLEAGASCELTTNSGVAPMHGAVANGHIEVVHLLLEAGASSEVVTTSGLTPLHCAVGNGHVEVVRLLLEAGTTCETGLTNELVRYATVGGHDEIIHLLQSGAPRKKRRKVTAS